VVSSLRYLNNSGNKITSLKGNVKTPGRLKYKIETGAQVPTITRPNVNNDLCKQLK